ncbi:MAG: DNA phosphorothioation system sulfurtransferase DndC [Holophagales bacterium]|nr:DNA phosphorothioation system sulfurtransferase DndC [Holophagales bacterium]
MGRGSNVWPAAARSRAALGHRMTAVISSVQSADARGGVANVVDRLGTAKLAIREQYLASEACPWVVAYSGGKDSTLLLQLTWEVIADLPVTKRCRRVYVVGNDTLVESPLVIGHLRTTLGEIGVAAAAADLPIETRITKPHVDQTFWVNVIGRGYIPPTRNFRWCTDRMKIHPTNRLLANLIRAHGGAVLLVGTRRSESDNRRRAMDRRGVTAGQLNPHATMDHCWMFAPLADFEDQDVWLVLMQRRPPWGGTHRNLITLYRNAGGGECPLVLTKDDAPSCGTSSPRFGCWTCTVVKKDRSLRGLIASGHAEADVFTRLFEFREWLVELRENDGNRESVRRDGNVRFRADGSQVMGPFTLGVRKQILEELRTLQDDVSQQLISPAEEEVIEDIWRRDLVREECRSALRAAVGLVPEEIAAG